MRAQHQCADNRNVEIISVKLYLLIIATIAPPFITLTVSVMAIDILSLKICSPMHYRIYAKCSCR